MSPQKIPSKAVWAVSAAVIVVVVLLILLFITQTPSAGQESIVLPPAQEAPSLESEAPSQEDAEEDDGSYFEVTNDNVVMALQTLNRPAAYHQSYTVTVGSDTVQASRNVDFWVNGQFLHAEISDEHQTRSVISDGNTAYIWYETDDDFVSVSLSSGTTIEDILGLPAFDSYLTLKPDMVVDSDYLVLEDPSVQCIFVCTQDESFGTSRYWINLDNGLLYQSDVLENSNQVYSIRQTFFETLAMEDESFRDRFLLPDGSAPFIAAREMPQP